MTQTMQEFQERLRRDRPSASASWPRTKPEPWLRPWRRKVVSSN